MRTAGAFCFLLLAPTALRSMELLTREELEKTLPLYSNYELKELASNLYEEILRLQARNFVNGRGAAEDILAQKCDMLVEWKWYLAIAICALIQAFCAAGAFLINCTRRKEEVKRKLTKSIS